MLVNWRNYVVDDIPQSLLPVTLPDAPLDITDTRVGQPRAARFDDRNRDRGPPCPHERVMAEPERLRRRRVGRGGERVARGTGRRRRRRPVPQPVNDGEAARRFACILLHSICGKDHGAVTGHRASHILR